MNFSIEHYEPNPHQTKEPMMKNRTYQRFSWREKYRLENYDENDAKAVFAKFGRNYRLVSRDTGDQICINTGRKPTPIINRGAA